MDAQKALDGAVTARKKLNSSDLVSANNRKAVIKYLDDLVPFLAGVRDQPTVTRQPAAPVANPQYGIMQYPGDKLLSGPFADPMEMFKSMGRYSPEAVRMVVRTGEKAPWTLAQ